VRVSCRLKLAKRSPSAPTRVGRCSLGAAATLKGGPPLEAQFMAAAST